MCQLPSLTSDQNNSQSEFEADSKTRFQTCSRHGFGTDSRTDSETNTRTDSSTNAINDTYETDSTTEADSIIGPKKSVKQRRINISSDSSTGDQVKRYFNDLTKFEGLLKIKLALTLN